MLLKHAYLACIGAFLALSATGGCTELGTPDYSSHDGLRPEPFNPPPVARDPFQPGDERLSVGYFYEGGWSVEFPINQVTTNYFIFGLPDDPIGSPTYTQVDSDDRLEGLISVEITLTGQPFWGGGIIWDVVPIDLSEWTTMFVGFKSSDPSFEAFSIKMQSGAVGNATEVSVNAATYDYANDGQWHFLEIPLEDFGAAFNPALTRSPFIIGDIPGNLVRKGDVLLIDNLYFTKDVPDDTGGAGGTSGSGACDSTALAYITTLDASFNRTNFVPIDMTNLPDTWDRYTISLDLTDQLLEGQLLQFGFQNTASDFASSGVFYDNIEVEFEGAGGSGGDGGPVVAEYEQDFESLDANSDTALADDGWRFFNSVFDGTTDPPTFKFGYGDEGNGAPTTTGQISGIAAGQGGSEQGAQQLSVFNDYNCCQPGEGHFNGTDRVEVNVFRERDIVQADIGNTITFSFDAKRGNINDGCPSP